MRGTKRVDLFECARVDPNYPVEDTIKELSAMAAEGKFDYIGLSECSADTLRRANKVRILFPTPGEVTLDVFRSTRLPLLRLKSVHGPTSTKRRKASETNNLIFTILMHINSDRNR